MGTGIVGKIFLEELNQVLASNDARFFHFQLYHFLQPLEEVLLVIRHL